VGHEQLAEAAGGVVGGRVPLDGAWEHTGNIQDILGNIQEHLGNIQGTFSSS
jgi:hypothetical protein